MRIKTGFVLHSMGDEFVVVAIEERTKDFCGMIRLNKTGAFLWKQMQQGEFTQETLKASLIFKYGITEELAEEAVTKFLTQLEDAQVVEK